MIFELLEALVHVMPIFYLFMFFVFAIIWARGFGPRLTS